MPRSAPASAILEISRLIAFVVAALTGLSLLPAAAWASEFKVTPSEKGEFVFIHLSGDIEKGDADKFRKLALKYDRAVVLLSSDGGYLPDALDIGKIVQINKYATSVFDDEPCNSACGLVWLAGETRYLFDGGRVGFHAAYVLDPNEAPKESGVANAMVGRYLTLLNLPEVLVQFATTAPPSSLRYITAKNAASLGIVVQVLKTDDNDERADTPRAPPPLVRQMPPQTATPSGKSPSSSLFSQVAHWSVVVDHTLGNACFIIGEFENRTIFRIGINGASSKQSYYLLFGNPKWTSLKDDAKYDVKFFFDDNAGWDFPVTVGTLGNQKVLLGVFSDARFWNEFVNSYTMRIMRGSTTVATLDLSKTKLAFDELARCQRAQM